MTRLPREPLDAEERALAARLPRLHGRDEPDAALDARILAVAHAAVSSPTPVATRRRGWIVPLTAAASVSLAVGLAWQLQPPPPAPSVSPADSAAASAGQAHDGEHPVMRSMEAAPPPTASAMRSPPMPMTSPARQTVPVEDDARIARERAPAEPVADARAAAPEFVPAPPPEAAMAETMQVEVMAPPLAPPAPPAPATPAAPQAALGRSAATDEAVSVSGTRARPEAKRVRAQNEADAAADASTLDMFSKAADEEDVPPATMDAPAARDAWLRRIGELQLQGKVDEARASLAEFRRRYPDAVLPPELRKLEP